MDVVNTTINSMWILEIELGESAWPDMDIWQQKDFNHDQVISYSQISMPRCQILTGQVKCAPHVDASDLSGHQYVLTFLCFPLHGQ